MIKTRIALATVIGACLLPFSTGADDAIPLTIKDHRFEPAELKVPAGKKLKLSIRNLDSTPEEFESYELNREKIIAGGKTGIIFIGPLDPGHYPYFGEFHSDTATGVIIAE